MSDEVKPLEPLKSCPVPSDWWPRNHGVVKIFDTPTFDYVGSRPTGREFWVGCSCGINGPRASSESEASELWNRRPEDEADDYVAYLCSRKVHRSGGFYGSSLKVCDSDADGAFKVYRRPADTKVKEWAERLYRLVMDGRTKWEGISLNEEQYQELIAIAEEMKNAGNS